jgi:hypothetical protein
MRGFTWKPGTMKRNLYLSARLREVLLAGHWIANTNYKELLESIDWQQAVKKTGNLNTIAALTYHINYYLAGLLNAFENGRLEIHDKYSFDMPPITSESGWKDLLAEFLENAEAFVRRVEQLDDNLLEQPFVDERYGSFLRNIEGIIEHGYYHLGQISLLKKITGFERIRGSQL